MAKITLDLYYDRGGTLIEGFSDGQYLSIADSAIFKDLFDNEYLDDVIAGTDDDTTDLEDVATEARFFSHWRKIFFAEVMNVRKKIDAQTAEAGLSAYLQAQNVKVNLYPQNGLTPITSGYASTEQKTETGISPELREKIAENQMATRHAITEFIKKFADLFNFMY